MRASSAAALLLTLVVVPTIASDSDHETHKLASRQQCSGMYSQKAWSGPVEPYISAIFTPQKPARRRDQETPGNTTKPEEEGSKNTNASSPSEPNGPIVSVVIFEWRDEALVGTPSPNDPTQRIYICDGTSVNQKLCTADQLGQYILAPDWNSTAHNPLLTAAVHLAAPDEVKYSVTHSGYYCVFTTDYTAPEFEGEVEFRNAYGQLEASQVPKLPFYGALTVVYGVLAVFWGFLYFQNRHDILAVQNYITAVVVFLIFEQFATWGFYEFNYVLFRTQVLVGDKDLSCWIDIHFAILTPEYTNTHGSNAFAKVLTIVVAVLNAARNSFSFFLLLIVCMGYGVVKQTLGKTMWYVRVLTGCHFFFSIIYVIASLQITPENAGPIVLLVVLPLAGTLTLFYIWTLNSLGHTRKDLLERKQTVKAAMYAKLWYCILGSIIVIFAFFFFNSYTFADRRDANFVPEHWKGRWFVLDGWLNLVYLVDISFIAYLWRPTVNNRRFAMSDELAQDDEGFEIASFGGSLDDEENARSDPASPRHNVHSGRGALSSVEPSPINDHASERRSLDGETIFAVGEDGDKWSDDESDKASRLAKKGA